MPYSKAFREANPGLVEKRQRKSSAKFNAAHPERVAAAKAAWYKINREKQLARAAKYHQENPDVDFNGNLRRKYGLTRERYDAIVLEQKGVCAICKGLPTGKDRVGRPRKWDVDHDHVTGKVRGLLCHSCNLMLGAARDRVDILLAAVPYLKRQS